MTSRDKLLFLETFDPVNNNTTDTIEFMATHKF